MGAHTFAVLGNRVGIGYGYHDADLQSDIVNSQLYVDGSIATSIDTFITDFTLDDHIATALGDATDAPFTFTLPDATTCKGRPYTIKKIDATGNAVHIASVSGQTFDGAASPYDLTVQWATVVIRSDGTNWIIESKM